MLIIVAVLVALLLPMLMIWGGVSKTRAWLASVAVVPAFVLFAEFVLPYSGGGASMWPIALVVGAVIGAAAGGLGTLIAATLGHGRGGDS